MLMELLEKRSGHGLTGSWGPVVDVCRFKANFDEISTKFADFYPSPIMQHSVSTQADNFLACSSSKKAEITENENSRDATVTTVSYLEDTT